jgi:hypothetical protein
MVCEGGRGVWWVVMECAEVCDGLLRCVVYSELLRCMQVYSELR